MHPAWMTEGVNSHPTQKTEDYMEDRGCESPPCTEERVEMPTLCSLYTATNHFTTEDTPTSVSTRTFIRALPQTLPLTSRPVT